MKKRAPSPKAKPRASQAFPVVGVGASAGGLEAFTQLLHQLPATTGMSFVLVQHLDPVHESELTRLLARATPMPTREASNNLRLKPNQIYVIPPNANLSVADGVLKLEPRPEGRAPHRSIDYFFESLAHDQQERAIGVILSGTGTDGTLGLEAIKSEGGITFAQDHSAKHESMPRSAIAAGCADFVLSPEDIANELVRIAGHPYVVAKTIKERKRTSGERERESAVSHQKDSAPLPSGGHGTPQVGAARAHEEAHDGSANAEADDFRQVLTILRAHCGVDFSLYKSSTIQRRIARRMVLSKQTTLADYAAFLHDNKAELDTLFSDVLISVTSFFRNPDAFDVLKDAVFPELLERWAGSDPVRVWVLGCSTGQEAYSIAMAFAEFADKVPRALRLQVFATDLNDALLDKARQGLYARTLAQDLSPERLRRFFVEEQGGYRVIKSLREQIVFARQNLISDPPFSRMDLISCRNLLIYLEPGLQRKIVPSFHYALRPGGFLFLGASESVGQFTDLFEVADKKQKIFRKKAAPVQAFQLPLAGDRGAYPPRERVIEKMRVDDGAHAELTAQREADRFAITQFAPPGVLINNELQVLQFRGSTSPYLEPPTGRATFDLLKMARRGLVIPLRTAINKARKDNGIVRKENVQIAGEAGTMRVTIQVVPLKNLKEPCFLILFEPVADAMSRRRQPPRAPIKRPGVREESRRIAELERELAELRDYHQGVQEQSEATNEELQASNEEVQSANEELQSINEELETSKEELESTNEELTTINEEMGSRNAELHRLNADLANLQSSISTAVVLLGRDLTIRRFTAPAEKIFRLLATDIGRPFSAIRHHLTTIPLLSGTSSRSPSDTATHAAFPLETVIEEVIDRVTEREGEVQDRDGRWYVLRIRPYMTLDKKIDGAVLTLTDIDALKRSEQEAKEALEYVRAILRTARSPLLVLDGDLIVKTANTAFSRVFKLGAGEVEGRSLLELSDGAWKNPQLRRLLEDILPRDGTLDDFEVTHDFPTIGVRTVLLNAERLQRDNKTRPLILLSMEDVTERKKAEQMLHDADHRKDEFLATLAHELRNPLAPISNAAQILNMTPEGSPAVRAASQVMLRQTDHIIRLIDDLLDASRISRGRIELRRGRVDVSAIVQQTVDTARSVEKDAREFTLALPPEPVFVNADPVRLTQIVGNLISNAVKFTQRTGHIGVSVDRHDDDVCIRVRDDGIGMAPDQIPRIFEMFTQLDTSLERPTSGLGIGLALARRLAELHDGSLDARSGGKNRGSEFIVRLPILRDAAHPPAKWEPAIGAPSMSGQRILIVDDNRDASMTLATLLQMAGNTTHIAGDGMEAVRAVETFRPDVALLDICLPRLNGYDTARQIREQPWGKDVLLIALTGLGAEHNRQQSRDAGFDGHLVKPTDFAAIAALVAESGDKLKQE